MKILKFSILYFIVVSVTFSQSGWVKQYGGTTENLNAVYFSDTNNGFIVGENGTLLRTVDGGSNWEKQTSGTTNNLARISFVDNKNGFIWGSNRTFLKTTDGGIIWKNLSDSLINEIIPSSFLDINNAITARISNDTIKVLKTSDSGKTWVLASNIKTYKNKINKYIYLDTNNILIMISRAQDCDVFHSSDGGKSWEIVLTIGGASDGGFVDASFIDSKTGWLMDFSGRTLQYWSHIYKTEDGGKSWKQASSLPQSQSICMIDSNNGFVVHNGNSVNKNNIIYKTTDGGISWESQFTNNLYRFKSVYFSNTEIGTIVGENGLILRTTTGGVKQENTTWEIVPSGVTTSLKRVFLVNENVGYCVSNELLKSTDIGKSWFRTNFWMSGYLNDYDIDIWFADQQNGIISAYIYIYTTTDGGENWQETKTSDHLFGAFCTDNLHKIVVGWGGTIKYTLDGGNLWNSANSGTNNHLKDVYFVNKDLGYVVGAEGTILRSDDRGATWRSLESNTLNILDGVYFTSNEVGIAIGTFGTILRTSDGGETWELQKSGTYNNLYSVFFRDKNNGLIVGELGVILRTNDGGLSWTVEESGINNSLFGLAIKDSVELAVGEVGTILRNISNVTTADKNETLPIVYHLKQNYPNPFNPGTTIEYSIPKQSQVTIKVYDILGRELVTLVNEEKAAGNYSVKFNGSNYQSGVYFYRIQSGSYADTRKFLLLK